MSEGASRKD